jgi:EAL domain-containing protein (putative c-di-GMP-specific phosphodiesterase class I)
MSFVQNITRNQDDAAITKAIIAMAHSLQLETIAEGIETTEQKEFLLLNGCNQGQGYLYSQPLPAEEATALLAKGMNFNDKRRDNSSERVDITIS